MESSWAQEILVKFWEPWLYIMSSYTFKGSDTSYVTLSLISYKFTPYF